MISVAVIFGAKTELPELDLLLEVGVGLSHVLVFAGCLASPVRRVAPPMQLSALWNYAYNSMVTMCRTYLRLKPQSKVRKKRSMGLHTSRDGYQPTAGFHKQEVICDSF